MLLGALIKITPPWKAVQQIGQIPGYSDGAPHTAQSRCTVFIEQLGHALVVKGSQCTGEVKHIGDCQIQALGSCGRNDVGGKGVDLVINIVGGSVFAECIRTLAFEGRLATVGYVDGVLHADMDIEALHAKRLKLYGVSNKLRTLEQRAQALPEFKKQILPLIAKGLCLPRIHETLPFERMIEAKAMMDSNQQLGKIVLEGLK